MVTVTIAISFISVQLVMHKKTTSVHANTNIASGFGLHLIPIISIMAIALVMPWE